MIPRNKGITQCQGLRFPSPSAKSYPPESELFLVQGSLEVGCWQKTIKQSRFMQFRSLWLLAVLHDF